MNIFRRSPPAAPAPELAGAPPPPPAAPRETAKTPHDLFDEKLSAVSAVLKEHRDDIIFHHAQEEARHRDGFSIQPVRFGDFLTLFVARKGIHENSKAVIAINLAKVNRITCEGGKPAGYLADEWVEGDHALDCWHADPVKRAKECHYLGAYHPIGDRFRYHRTYGGSHGTLPGVPQPSVDDIIHFHGTDTSICVPFGMVEEVFALLIKEIGEGYDRPAVVDVRAIA
ncbi:hypothetical protein [Sphingobium sp. MK2]|uniref:hypothetical protein n=1 Tax=Sphingobium sp. MK2 TaxID=3116540 RepID=UPI0032E35EDE